MFFYNKRRVKNKWIIKIKYLIYGCKDMKKKKYKENSI